MRWRKPMPAGSDGMGRVGLVPTGRAESLERKVMNELIEEEIHGYGKAFRGVADHSSKEGRQRCRCCPSDIRQQEPRNCQRCYGR